MQLKATLREKRHYLVIEILSKEKLNENFVSASLRGACKTFLGTLEFASASFRVIDIKKIVHDEELNLYKIQIILAIDRKSIGKARVAIILINKIDGKKVLPYVKGVSGTLKRARMKFI